MATAAAAPAPAGLTATAPDLIASCEETNDYEIVALISSGTWLAVLVGEVDGESMLALPARAASSGTCSQDIVAVVRVCLRLQC